MAESYRCESFCHQTALKSLTRSEKKNKILSESKFNLYMTCFHKKLCVISQQKRSFSFKIFLILWSLHTAMFLRGNKSWHSIKASTGSIFRLIRTPLALEWVSESVRSGVSDWVNQKGSEWVSQSEGEWVCPSNIFSSGKSEVLKVAWQCIYLMVKNKSNPQHSVFV